MTVLHTDRTIPLALNSGNTAFSSGLQLGWDFTGDDTDHKDGTPWIYVGATAPVLPVSGSETITAFTEPGIVAGPGSLFDYTNATNFGLQFGSGDFMIAVRWTTGSTLPAAFNTVAAMQVLGSSGNAFNLSVNENAGVGWYSNITGSTSVPIGSTNTGNFWPVNTTILTMVQKVAGIVTVYELNVTAAGALVTRKDPGSSASTNMDSTWASRMLVNYNGTGDTATFALNSIWCWNKSFSTTDLTSLARNMYDAQANGVGADTIAITSPTASSTIGSESVISGTYVGTLPTGIEVQFGAGSWVAGTSMVIGSGTWSGIFVLASGGPSTLKAREANQTGVISPSIASITVDADTISFTAPTPITSAVDYRIFQRNGSNQATMRISGTYSGSPTSLEYSWHGGSYTALGGTLGSGAFDATITLTGPEQGDLIVRFANKTLVRKTLKAVGVGDVFIVSGQSNHQGGGGAGSGFTPPVAPAGHPRWVASEYDGSAVWRANVETSAQPFVSGAYASYFGKLATLLMAQGIPVAFVPCALGGTGISSWPPGGGLYNAMVARTQAVGSHKGMLWWQGETDCGTGTTNSSYQTQLNAIINDWSVIQFPGDRWVIMNINAGGNSAGSGGTGPTDTGFNAIHAAIASVAGSNTHVAGIADMNGLFASLHYFSVPEIAAVASAAYGAIWTAFYVPYAAVSLVDSGGSPLANLTGLKWAFFDQATPDAFLAPTGKGSGAVSDSGGLFRVPLNSTALAVGNTGWLVVSNSDGTATQSPPHKAFSGPVVLT
jgi:hypothetical protein